MFELEGEAERIIRAGEAFWEPGGDVIHYQAANNLADVWSRFVVVMIGAPDEMIGAPASRCSRWLIGLSWTPAGTAA